MSSPLIWIVVPALTGLVLYFLRRWFRFTVTVGVGMAAALAGLAWFLPIGVRFDLGAWSFKLADTYEILGRLLVLGEQDRHLLWMVYTMAAFWFMAVYITRAGRMTVPLGLMMVAFLIAGMAVEPLLFAALLVEIAVLVSIPIFIQPGLPGIKIDRKLILGGLRLLTLQTLGMALLLLTGWALSGIETMPGREIVTRATSLLAFGFALVLGIFPFHTWIPILSEKAHPYAAALVLAVLSWMGLLLLLRFLDRYSWLSQVSAFVFFLRVAGILMILVGGGSAAFERHLGRILGYTVLVETGYGLLAASNPESQSLILTSLLPRVVSFGVLALAISVLQMRASSLALVDLRGLGIQMPFACATLVLALLSVTGLPTLAFFPFRLAMWEALASQAAWLMWISLLGPVGLLVATTRVMLSLIGAPETSPEDVRESRQILILMGIAIGLLFLVGLFPHLFSPIFMQGIRSFENLVP